MAALFSRLLNDLMPGLPGISANIVLHEVRRAAQDFLTQTRAWQETLDTFIAPAGESQIELIPDSNGAEIVRIESAWSGSKQLLSVPLKRLDNFIADWNSQSGDPEWVTQLTPTVIRLFPTPNQDVTLRFRVSLRPSDTATALPSELMAQYTPALIAGAKGRLLMMGKKPWSNPPLGALFVAQFEKLVADTHYQSALSFGQGRVRARPSFC